MNASDANGHIGGGPGWNPANAGYDESAAFDYDLTPGDLASIGVAMVPGSSFLDAREDFKNGSYGWATTNTIIGVIDVASLGADTEVSGPFKGLVKGTRITAKMTERMVGGFRKTLAEAGKLRVGDKAHHIVEKGDMAADATRKILDKYGVGIHSTDNGIGLSGHAGRHSADYSRAVFNRLSGLKSAADIRRELEKIGRELRKYDDAGKKVNDWAKDQLN